MYTTYILYSLSLDNYYIGYTGDVMETRLFKHLSNHRGYTARAKDWSIVYTEQFATKPEAMAREKQLKSWKSKTRIRQFIERSTE